MRELEFSRLFRTKALTKIDCPAVRFKAIPEGSRRSDEGRTLETSALETLCNGQFTSSTAQFIKPNHHLKSDPSDQILL